jgi:hypothetical protein
MNRIGFLIFTMLLLLIAAACSFASESSYSTLVWEDLDGDGKQGADENPMSGVIVQIVDSSNGLLWQRAVTDSDGNIFPFTPGVGCEQYDIYLSVPDEYWPTTPVIVNTTNCATAKFGLKPYP